MADNHSATALSKLVEAELAGGFATIAAFGGLVLGFGVFAVLLDRIIAAFLA